MLGRRPRSVVASHCGTVLFAVMSAEGAAQSLYGEEGQKGHSEEGEEAMNSTPPQR